MSTDVELWLYSGSHEIDILALSIPVAECRNYAIHPLKWMKYLGYAIYGAEGRLSTRRDGLEICDFAADVELAHTISYQWASRTCRTCHTSRSLLRLSTFSDPPRFVDVDAVNERTSNASELTERRSDFRERVIERDGTCVITTDLAHILTLQSSISRTPSATEVGQIILSMT